MTMETVRVAVEGYFKTAWASYCPVFYENDKIVPSEDTYVALSLLKNGSRQASLGAIRNRYRFYYILQLDIYAPSEKGMKSSNLVDQKFRDLFTGLSLQTTDMETINFLEPPAPRTLGFKSGRYRTVIRSPCYADQLRARATP